jgi:hypothetical protein
VEAIVKKCFELTACLSVRGEDIHLRIMAARLGLHRLLFAALPMASFGIAMAGSRYLHSSDRGVIRNESASVFQAASPNRVGEKEGISDYVQRLACAESLEALATLWEEVAASLVDHPAESWIKKLILERMVEVDATAGWAWCSNDNNRPAYIYLSAWAGKDHLSAATAVLAGPKESHVMLQFVARGWAATDPVAYLRDGVPVSWGISHDFILQSLRANALAALSAKDLPKALRLASENLDSSLYIARDLIAKLSTRMIAARGASGALTWAQSLRDCPKSMQTMLQASVLSELALDDPKRAAAELRWSGRIGPFSGQTKLCCG